MHFIPAVEELTVWNIKLEMSLCLDTSDRDITVYVNGLSNCEMFDLGQVTNINSCEIEVFFFFFFESCNFA